ncbi:MAG: VWA domain-containing protein [Deltaproteobacteria bacterium]|nr:VWA domain-containing protein [Deltaproteobacteria bacterium]
MSLLQGALLLLTLALPGLAGATGLLLPTDGSLGPLAIRSHRVDVSIQERVAETRVVQVFRNGTNRQLEATYIFPVPQGAVVSGFAMTVNGVRQEGQLLEAAEARSIYEGIVARMQDPGLVEYLGGNLFRARVFPIPPLGDQTVELRFTQTLDYQSGTLHYRYPLRTTGPQAATLEDFTLRAQIVSRTAIRAVYSPTHRIDTARRDEHAATVGFEEGRASLDRDFDLYYTVADGDVGLSVLTHRPAGEDGYFLMMVAPRTEVTDREIIGKDLLFVVDTSGSMSGEKIRHAREALAAWVQRLNPDDTFNVLRFSTDVERMSDVSLAASPDNRARALRFINGFEASGGTAIEPALRAALEVPVRRGAPRIVVFLTDGMPTIGETDVQRIVQGVAARNAQAQPGTTPAQIFVFGLGDDVNTTFLDLLAQQNRGTADYAGTGAEMATVLDRFYNRIAFPVLADLRLALPGADAYDIYPRDLGTLYRGGQLVVTGRYRTAAPVRVGLTATVAGQQGARTFEWPVTLPARDDANAFIPRVWGSRKVGYLLDEIRLRGENPELRDAVVQLARRFGIVTPYTSYLVTETPVPSRAVDDLMNRAQPTLAVPAGAALDPTLTVRGGADRDRRPAPDAAARPSRAPSAGSTADFRAFGRLGGGTGGGSAAAPVMPSAPPARAPMPQNMPTTPTPTVMAPPPPPQPAPAAEATGEEGRRLSNSLRTLREAERVDTGAGGTRYVGGRALVQRDGSWAEEGLTTTGRVLRVRSLGRSYFALLRLRPALRELLAVGQRVRFRLDSGRIIDVAPDHTDVSDADVEAFLR